MALRALIALAVAVLTATAALAEEAAGNAGCGAAAAGNPILACVNGAAIHKDELLAAAKELPAGVQDQPMDRLYPFLMNQLVAEALLEQEARKEKVAEDPEHKLSGRALVDLYVERLTRDAATDEKLHALYDEYVKRNSGEEVCARHILVPTEAEAKAIIAELQKGADFATVATEKTTDPSGKTSGGDLGCFRRETMVKEFSDAAFALQKGQITQTPVKSSFGWHVIKVEDRHPANPPSFEELKPRLVEAVERDVVGKKLRELAKVAKIEVFNIDGSPRPPPAAAPPAAAPPQ
jgi:peptidyl-prolyl cis-trans isomerase C